MITAATLRELAFSLPETTEQPHFEKTSFRVGKKIFATLDTKVNCAYFKLSEIDQDVFSSIDRTMICPLPNKWGIKGWTSFDLSRVPEDILFDAMKRSYCEVAPKKLSEQFRKSNDSY